MYDFKEAKARVLEILSKKISVDELEAIPKDETKFTFENGIRSWVTSIFVDIEDSTTLFKSEDLKITRIMRAFTSEIIEIFIGDPNYRQIGIRGDCVYGIFSTPTQKDVNEVFLNAVNVNSFLLLFNELLEQNHFQKITAGIGLGCSKDLVIKAGKSGSGINDLIWVGKAVVDASNLSGIANRNGIGPIAMNDSVFDSIIGRHKLIEKSFIRVTREKYYYCGFTSPSYEKWVSGGKK
jgi:class 3 adenylate cyclase